MKIDVNALTVDASYLAAQFGLSPDAFRRNMKQGLVRSRVEVGAGEESGRIRLTVRLGNRMWIAITDAEGDVLSDETCFVTSRAQSRSTSMSQTRP